MGNGIILGQDRMTQSTPANPYDQPRTPTSSEVNGLAETLIGGVLVAQGLGEYCDPEFVGYTAREMQEALDMTPEEMNLAAHQILSNERSPDSYVVVDGSNNTTYVGHGSKSSFIPIHNIQPSTPMSPISSGFRRLASTKNSQSQPNSQRIQYQRNNNNSNNNGDLDS